MQDIQKHVHFLACSFILQYGACQTLAHSLSTISAYHIIH